MRILAIESSAVPASCCVWEDGRILAHASQHGALQHSRTLLPMCEEVLARCGAALSDMHYIAVAAGPGSFTGVRIGVAAVKGLSFADDIPCIPVSTLEALACRVEGLPFTGTVCTVLDARAGQVYTACFAAEDGTLPRLTEDEALPLTGLGERLKNVKKPILLLGDGAELCYNTLKDGCPDLRVAPAAWRYQDALGVAAAAAKATDRAVDGAALLPHYLRLPQAERELRAKNGAADKP